MKNVARSIIIIVLSIAPIASSMAQKFFTVDQKIKSSDSRIEKNKDGQTILISEFSGQYANSANRIRAERKYLGTPFFEDQWFMGSMYVTENNKVSGVMAYNLVTKIVYYAANEADEATEVKPNKFSLGEIIFQKLKDVYNGAGDDYYEILSDGEPKLLKEHIGHYSPTYNGVRGTYGSSQQDQYEGTFEKRANYYIVIQKQLLLINNKKGFFKSLGPYAEKAIDFVDQENLNLRNEEDILKLISRLDEGQS